MRKVRGLAIHLDHFVIFAVLKVREPLDDDVDGPPAVVAVEIFKAPRRLDANEVWKILVVIQSVFLRIRKNLVLLGRARWLARLGASYRESQRQDGRRR